MVDLEEDYAAKANSIFCASMIVKMSCDICCDYLGYAGSYQPVICFDCKDKWKSLPSISQDEGR